MGNKDVYIFRNLLPDSLVQFRLVLKGSITIIKRIRRPKYLNPLNLHSLMLEIDTSLLQLSYNLRSAHLARVFLQLLQPLIGIHDTIIEHDLMVAGHNDLVPEIDCVQRIEEVLEALLRPTFGEIAGMDEDVPFFTVCCLQDQLISAVGVRDCDYFELLPGRGTDRLAFPFLLYFLFLHQLIINFPIQYKKNLFAIHYNLNIIVTQTKQMAEQQGGVPFQFTKQGEKVAGKSSRDYTGRGYAVYPNGDQYNGDYVDGIREGKGKYIFVNGDKYEGDFKNNKKHGIGKLTYKDKGEYYGQWENGTKHGQGTYSYQNKDTYSGWWQFGKKKGKGTYTYASTGMKLVGNWQQDKFVQGKWIFPNGTSYSGEFKDNKPNGKGVWSINSGNSLSGNYKQTVIPNEDPDDTKVNLKLDWQSETGIGRSAWLVNSHENF